MSRDYPNLRHVHRGGAVLGLLFPHEPLTPRKAIGILLAIASIYLIAGQQKP